MEVKNFKTLDDFKTELISDSDMQNQFKADPIAAISQIQQKKPLDDVWIYRIVVLALGITILSIILGTIVLIAVDRVNGDAGVPTILTAIGSAAIGALAGLLAPTSTKNN